MARYDSEFNPILLEDHTATLYGTGLPEDGLNVKCVTVGALPEHWVDFGALAAGTWDTGNTTTDIDMNTMELAQFRMRIVTEMKMRLHHPGPVAQWRTRNVAFYLPQFPVEMMYLPLQDFYWKASEFFVFEDHTPVFELYANRAQTTSIVMFSGWRLKLTTITTPGRIKIWTSEWPTISSTPRYPR